MKLNRLLILFIVILGLLVSCSEEAQQDKVPIGKDEAVTPIEKVLPLQLQGARWLNHFKGDLLPYWISPEAKGDPQGNFPTFRGMDGRVITEVKDGKDPTVRFPRMLARQVYFYSVGYMLTGDGELLQLAKDGCDWLAQHALDKTNGGWYALLDKSGKPVEGQVKYAQDTSYVAQAFAAYYFVTRDKEMEKYVLMTRDWIFNQYWDAANKRVKDGLSEDMKSEIDQGGDKGWELVAQLDQINAYMMLVQPVLSDPANRAKFLGDMKTLADTMVKHFLADGIFWGIHNNKGKFNTRHVDFGHTLKSFWMLLQLDKRLPSRPYREIVDKHIHGWLDLAYHKTHGTWGDKMLKDENGKLAAKYGSLWWSYAELDQVSATLNMEKEQYTGKLTRTAKHWLEGFVDQQYKEVYFGIKEDGSKGWDWKVEDVSKCSLWKNGFHSAEHALVMYIHGKTLEKKPVELYFAVPAAKVKTFIAKPYIFNGIETGRLPGKPVTVDGKDLVKVKVVFGSVGGKLHPKILKESVN